MDKEEFRVKLDQINHLVEKNDYKGAMEIVDSIDWRRVKNVRTLCVVGEIYAANKRYEDSKEIFLLAYHKAPIGKNILYRLIEVSLKTGNIEEAMEYYEEYLQVAPNDSTKYVLKYKIYKENNASLDELIKILEDYKEKEFTEKWSYELAKLYYEAGEKDKCLSVCNEMNLWFSDGKYVLKAMELKEKLGALTDAEKEKIAKQQEAEKADEEKVSESEGSAEETEDEESADGEESEENTSMIGSISTKEEDVNYSESIQERISKGIRDIFNSKKRETEETDESEEDEESEEDVSEEETEEIAEEETEEEFEDVPVLEEEDGSVKEIKKPEKEEKKTKLSLKMPELRIPKGLKKLGLEDAIKVPDLPKLNKVGLVDPKPLGEEEEETEFNLEDTILAAASAQGIEIPEAKNEDEEILEEVLEGVEEEFEEVFEEEDQEESEEVVEEVIEKAAEEMSEEETSDMDEFLSMFGKDEKEEPEEKNDNLHANMISFQEELRKTLGGEKEETDTELKFEVEDNEEAAASEEDTKLFKDVLEESDEEESFEIPVFEEDDEEESEDDLMKIYPRDHELTENEIELFSYFVKVPGMEEQILNTLEDAQMAAADKTSRTGNIVVMGGKETGKTKLISALIPAICKELYLEATKVAYVFADQINGKNIPEIISKLSSGFLVIEEANQLDKKTVEQLDKAMEFRTDGLTIILEDEKIGMRKFLARYPKFAKKFTSIISIPIFTNDELVNFANVYTKENGYTIDPVGMTALYELIGSNQKADEPMAIGAVKEILDAAIEKSQSGLLKFKRKRTNEDGFMVLTDKDFNI